jgi:hypothetical protein
MQSVILTLMHIRNRSFPLDGGRPVLSVVEGPEWGCERKYKSPPPLSSPVEGEDGKSRNAPDSSLIAAVFFIGLLLFVADASAQLKKIRLCAPGLGSGIMHAYVAKERGYFAQEGLDLDVLVARGQICTMALLNGQMELFQQPEYFRCHGCRKI